MTIGDDEDRRAPRHLAAALTARERDVLRLVCEGLSNAEISARLFLSEATIKTHIRSMLAKLDLRDRTQLVIAAYESGFTDDTARAGRGPRLA